MVQGPLDKFIVKESPEIKFADDLVTNFIKIFYENTKKNNFFSHMNQLHYTLKLAFDLLSQNIKNSPNEKEIRKAIETFLHDLNAFTNESHTLNENVDYLNTFLSVKVFELKLDLEKIIKKTIKISQNHDTIKNIDI